MVLWQKWWEMCVSYVTGEDDKIPAGWYAGLYISLRRRGNVQGEPDLRPKGGWGCGLVVILLMIAIAIFIIARY
ncbi:MAG: hypothetical protein D6681_00350 [Calditrichaeota bacterium]|nr:MAG: hypothetical protein D6681_00350 [Calditrichota bacterium]